MRKKKLTKRRASALFKELVTSPSVLVSRGADSRASRRAFVAESRGSGGRNMSVQSISGFSIVSLEEGVFKILLSGPAHFPTHQIMVHLLARIRTAPAREALRAYHLPHEKRCVETETAFFAMRSVEHGSAKLRIAM